MNQKGMAAAVIATIVVVIVIAAGAGIYFVIRGGGGPDGLPIYPRSQSWEITSEFPSGFYSELNISGDVEIVGYCVEGATIQEINPQTPRRENIKDFLRIRKYPCKTR